MTDVTGDGTRIDTTLECSDINHGIYCEVIMHYTNIVLNRNWKKWLYHNRDESFTAKQPILRIHASLQLFSFNPFKPEFIIVIFIHYKPRIADAILKTCRGWRWFEVGEKLTKIAMNWKSSFMKIPLLKPLSCSKIKSVFRDVKWCFNASRGLKGLNSRKWEDL